MSIFKAYDIRGKYPDELDEQKTYLIGRAIARYFGVKHIAVGCDIRLSSESLKSKLIQGLMVEGVAVTDLGVVTTPMSYFASGFYKFPATVMVTASHNPPEYNGFKICRENAMALSETTGLREIERITAELQVAKSEIRSIRAQAQIIDIKPEYKKFILGLIQTAKPLKIVVDTANGSVGPIFEYIFQDTPFKFIRLYFPPDGRFPNHEPNPMKDENLNDIKEAIVREQADFGVAFDGDGDRCIFLDETGARLGSDLVTALIARQILAEKPAPIIYDLRSSWVVREEITNSGGRAIRERVGHAFIKQTMRKNNAPFGGELSGHYYFRENYFADSGLIALVQFINAVARQKQAVSAIIRPLQRYFNSGEINFEVADKDARLKEIARRFSDGKQDWLDGLTVEYPDYWFNVRPSNTEPLLRLNIEAKTPERLKEIKEKLLSLL